MYRSAAMFARDLGLEDTPIVAYNGALIQEYPTERMILHEPVPLETCKALAAFCEARGWYLQAYQDDRLYVPELNALSRAYAELAKVEVEPVGSLFFWLQAPSTKLLIIADPAQIPQIQIEVRHLLGPSAEVTPSLPPYLEITNAKVSKGAALATVAASMGIGRDEVMAIGDAMNDLSMISWAGTGVAIGHAPEAVRRAAAYITQSGPGDGVAEALIRFGLAGNPG